MGTVLFFLTSLKSERHSKELPLIHESVSSLVRKNK